MEIISYNKTQLKELINSSFYRQLDYLPISYLRAVSQIANPYAAENDILLWVIYNENQLVGYLGALPDKFLLNKKELKIYWLSCLWIAPGFRGKGIKDQLLEAAIALYGDSIAITNVLYFLEKPYQKLGIFQPTQNNFGKNFYINPDFSDLIFAKYTKLKAIEPVYLFLEKTLTPILRLRFGLSKKRKHSTKIVEDIQINSELDNFLTEFSKKNDHVVRKIDHFNWILEFPWMRVGKPDDESKKYFFSSIAESFNYYGLKLYDNDKLKGFCLLKERDKRLSICYLYSNEKDKSFFADYILNLSISKNINSIFSMDQTVSDYLEKRRSKFIVIRNIRRPYLLPKNIEISSNNFQFGDSDIAFT